METSTYYLVVIIISILSNFGVIGMIGFLFKRLIADIDGKVGIKEFNHLASELKRNFDEDKERDKKLDTLIASVNTLVEQMRNINTSNKCGQHDLKLQGLEVRVVKVEGKIEHLENTFKPCKQ